MPGTLTHGLSAAPSANHVYSQRKSSGRGASTPPSSRAGAERRGRTGRVLGARQHRWECNRWSEEAEGHPARWYGTGCPSAVRLLWRPDLGDSEVVPAIVAAGDQHAPVLEQG